MDFSRFECLTFDCYGTLIDWEAGIISAIQPVLRDHGIRREEEYLLALYSELESQAEAGPYKPYRAILNEVMAGFAKRLGFALHGPEQDALAGSVGSWPPFPDTVAALACLKRQFRLGIISNVDDDLFARTSRLLQVDFDWVVTAEQARSYKPSTNNFEMAARRIAIPRARWCHVAQSLYHDIGPARHLGLATVWINRRAGRSGPGATPAAGHARADAEFPDLRLFAAACSPRTYGDMEEINS
ncbi:MAG: haloacid dehalogenase type II [Acidobacteria bacterium]|nr:haloacid dehalogenase type II [Acidobacteriota bacterium]